MGFCKSLTAILAASLVLSLFYQAQAVVNTTAAAEVVRLAAADPTVLATANNVITAVRNSALTNGLTSFDVATVTADPKVQAAVVPFIEAAAAAAGPAWLDIVPQTAADPIAAAQVLKLALADPDVLAAAKTLIGTVQLAAVSNPLNGYSVTALAANPSVQAAVVPLVVAAAKASGVEWAAVDTTAVLAAAATAAAVPAAAPAAASLSAQQVASFQAAMPSFPSLFSGRKLQQVILNPGDFLGLPTDASKATPSNADAARLNSALGLTGQQTAQDAAFQQEQATARVSNRMSDSATTSAAMQNFDVSSLNPTGNNVRATQQFRQQTQPAGASSGAAAPAAAQAAYAFAPAPYDPTAAPQKVAVMNADGSYQVQQPAQSAAAYGTSSNLAAAAPSADATSADATSADATQATGQVNVKPANQVAPSQIRQGTVLQRPGTPDTASPTTDSAGSSTAAQDILTSLGGGLADSPGVSPAPQGQAFDWLNPNPNAPPVPADSVVAQRAAGNVAQPPASQDSQNVRNFVSQAGFTTGKGGSSTAATTQQQQGRRLLAEAQRISAPSGAQPAAGDDVPAIAMRVAQAFGQAATQLLTNPSNPPASAPSSDILLVGPALSPSSITGELQLQPVAKPPTTAPALAPAPSTSMTAEVASAAASLAAPILAGQGRGPTDPPKPPLHELVDAAAELPARLGILPALPGMQGAPDAGQSQQASAAAASQLQTMFTMPANQGPGVVPAQRGSVAGSGMTGVGRRMLQK